MKAPLNNFIPISRNLFKHEFWQEKRTYSKFEAWLDLIASARFDNSQARLLIGTTVVRWKRGEIVASIRFLGNRWSWSKTKSENFLNMLKAEKMIKTRTANGTQQTIITICNYESYNAIKKISGQQEGHLKDTSRTLEGHLEDKSNKDNKDQKSKKRETYRHFAHLVLFTDEFLKLIDLGYTQTQVDNMLNEIENYKNNKKYKSLYFTAKKWLEKENLPGAPGAQTTPGGRIVKIASAFEQALQHA